MAKEHEKPTQQENLPDRIPPEVAKVIKDLPKEKQQIITQAILISKHSIGPLPDSETIKVYSEVIPNGGDRLMATVEKQLAHRFIIETTSVRRTFNQSAIGQIMAFVIAIAFGFICWDLGKSGHDTLAGVIGAIDIVGLVAVFITGRLRKK